MVNIPDQIEEVPIRITWPAIALIPNSYLKKVLRKAGVPAAGDQSINIGRFMDNSHKFQLTINIKIE